MHGGPCMGGCASAGSDGQALACLRTAPHLCLSAPFIECRCPWRWWISGTLYGENSWARAPVSRAGTCNACSCLAGRVPSAACPGCQRADTLALDSWAWGQAALPPAAQRPTDRRSPGPRSPLPYRIASFDAEGSVYAAWYRETPVAVKKTRSLMEIEMNLHAGRRRGARKGATAGCRGRWWLISLHLQVARPSPGGSRSACIGLQVLCNIVGPIWLWVWAAMPACKR